MGDVSLKCAKADDLPFAIHMFIFAAAAILAVIMIARNAHRPAASQAEYLDSVVRAGAIATVFWGVVGFCAAMAMLVLGWFIRVRRVRGS